MNVCLLNTEIAGLYFATVSCGNMPSAVGTTTSGALPSGFTNNNTFIVALRILRGGLIHALDGQMCHVYLQSNRLYIGPTQDGATYCGGQAISAIVART